MATVETKGATLYYESHGSGPVVLFAHGRGGNTLSWWQQVPVFASRYRVIVFDHRGFGRSRCDAEHFTCDHFHDDIMAILDAEAIDRASLVCQSMGGWGGLKAAVTYPARVSALVLCNTPGGLDTPLANAAIDHLASGAVKPGSGQLGETFIENHPAGAHLCRQISALNSNFPKPVLRLTRARTVRQEELRDYAVPTLLLTSPEDRLFPPPVIEEVAGIIPGAHLARIPTAGHSTYFEAPKVFNETLLAFLGEALSAESQ